MKLVRLVAFYLPQFHPIPENDAWWGRGFTEWSNVTRAFPLFRGHRQPRRPADLEYYDLRVADTREQQAALARSYGVHGFCYYYYWFDGRRLLERPLEEVVASGRPDFPFCICWANENWTRRWDGMEQEVLIRQDHTPDSDRRFIRDVLPILADRRYIRWGGRPLLLVYRPDLLPDPERTVAIWREACRDFGLPGLHVVGCQTFGTQQPPAGFDAAVEFPPHGVAGSRLDGTVLDKRPDFAGKIHDYREAAAYFSSRAKPAYRLHRSVMVAWDNTPRRLLHGHVWNHATPDAYGRWLASAIDASRQDPDDAEPLVFVNAWNEWAEGAYLEPDDVFGHAYLQETRRALVLSSGERAPDLDRLDEPALRDRVEALARANEWLSAELDAHAALVRPVTSAFTPERPSWLPAGAVPDDGQLVIEELGPLGSADRLLTTGGRRLRVSGWARVPGIDCEGEKASAALLLLDAAGCPAYFAGLNERVARPDVARLLGPGAPARSGFAALARCEGVAPGRYEIAILQRNGDLVALTRSGRHIVVPEAGA